jgi:hypothetical protein
MRSHKETGSKVSGKWVRAADTLEKLIFENRIDHHLAHEAVAVDLSGVTCPVLPLAG